MLIRLSTVICFLLTSTIQISCSAGGKAVLIDSICCYRLQLLHENCGLTDLDAGIRPCQYDEGSPLLSQTSQTTFFAMGIVSKNLGCGDSEIFETIYTRLSAYYGWLLRTGGPQP